MHLEISEAQARRFLVARHLLDPPRSLPARAESVLDVVRRLGSLQFDPLEVTGARNHELVLAARIAGYQRGWCERWLYGADRQLFEAYNKALNILPVSELPHYRIAWLRAQRRYGETVFRSHKAVAQAILRGLRDGGPQATTSFSKGMDEAIVWGWGRTKVGRALLEALFASGRVAIAHREGNTRYYDLTERLFPAELLRRREAEAAAMSHRLLSRHRGIGLMGAGGASEITHGTGDVALRKRMTAKLVATGQLVTVFVEGVKGVRHILGEELELLRAAEQPRKGASHVTFLAPLDPLMWDRKLVKALFGFQYVWEVYTPIVKRQHGYYVLPMLYGDRLVGRIEPRFERAAGRLDILGIWFEAGFEGLADPAFLRALGVAACAHARVASGHDDVPIRWPRGKVGTAIARALG